MSLPEASVIAFADMMKLQNIQKNKKTKIQKYIKTNQLRFNIAFFQRQIKEGLVCSRVPFDFVCTFKL